MGNYSWDFVLWWRIFIAFLVCWIGLGGWESFLQFIFGGLGFSLMENFPIFPIFREFSKNLKKQEFSSIFPSRLNWFCVTNPCQKNPELLTPRRHPPYWISNTRRLHRSKNSKIKQIKFHKPKTIEKPFNFQNPRIINRSKKLHFPFLCQQFLETVE